MNLLNLYLSFFKIGLFGFGGGYAMIPLMQQEIIKNGWIKTETFLDIIAIAEMTPGPVTINSGTFIGYQVSGFIGALLATVGVVTPSFILIIVLAYFIKIMKEKGYLEAILLFLRPAVIGLIIAAAFTIGKTGIVDYISAIILSTILLLLLVFKTKLHPIILIAASGLAGIILYS